MAQDRYTVTTHTSWFSRIKNSLFGIVIGLLLIPLSMVALFWNEGRAVTTARSLAEGAGLVVSIDAGKVDAANEGKLVHVSAPIVPDSEPRDEGLGIGAPGLRLERKVEMFQWVEKSQSETRKTLGGGEETVTTYSYVREWASEPVNTAEFHEQGGRQNPPFPITSTTFRATGGKIGAFTLTADQLDSFGAEAPLKLTSDNIDTASVGLGTTRPIQIVSDALVVSEDPTIPQVGDLRISYMLAKAGDASLVAQQTGSGFRAYQTESGDALFLAADGNRSAAEIFSDAESANTLITWVIRVVGLILMFVGFKLVFGVLSVLGDVIPLVGSIIGFGTSLVAIVLTLVLGPATIAVAWLFYRPLVSLAIAGAGILAAVLIAYLKGRKAQPAPA